jgi:asparagine synthase (glutamine-hydrolysing)
MCGIVGQFGTSINETWLNQELINLRHRGPDAQSSVRVNENLILGSTRLAMTDPNPRSNQPMVSDLRSSIISFNGEIYNYKELRGRLENQGIVFQTESDTEVLLKWLDIYGVPGIKDFNGMYAFAYYSSIEKKLILARDSLGKKPLYTLLVGKNLYWSSDMNSLLVHAGKPQLNRQALYEYLSLGYTLYPSSILSGVQAVTPGVAISYSEELTSVREIIVPSSHQIGTDLRATLVSAVKNRVEGHPHVALSLSGGLDSTIIAVALKELGVSFQTYSAIWTDSDKSRYNTDAVLAKEISLKLGVENVQVDMIKSENLPPEIDKFVSVMGEPNNNPSGISMLKLYEKIARDKNRLVLTGDGADELFGGYARHLKVSQMNRILCLPSSIQTQIAIRQRTPWSRVVQNIASSQLSPNDPLGWLHWHWVFRPADISKLLPGFFNNEEVIRNLSKAVAASLPVSYSGSSVQSLLLRDTNLWLVNESNRKLDRISMEYSIEARSPFQDDAVIALGHQLMNEGNYKLLNKRILRDLFPETVKLGVRDDKAGFTSPVGHWLRCNAEFLADSLRRLNYYEIFSKSYLESLILAPGTGSYQKIMQSWTMLIFSRWIESLENEVEI